MQQARPPKLDPYNAFISRFRIPGTPGGPLSGLTFAVKDLIDIEGQATTCGTPDWNPDLIPAAKNAATVQALLDAGADCVGRTVTDEVSLGILGENAHHGPVENPRAPGRLPGGSSSGSAAAVAGGLCDIALGTDTGGSIRVPASFCGLYGLRPTHADWGVGTISKAGMMTQAASFDTAGPFADTADVFVRAASVLLGGKPTAGAPPKRLFLATQAIELAEPAVREALAPAFAAAAKLIGPGEEIQVHPMGLPALFAEVQQVLQPNEARASFDEWLDTRNPRLGWEVAMSRVRAMDITREQVDRGRGIRAAFRRRLADLLGTDAVLAMPTTPFPAPPQGLRRSQVQPLRPRIMQLTCIGGLSGLPQVSLPLGKVDGLPVGLSFLAAPGREDLLFHLALALAG